MSCESRCILSTHAHFDSIACWTPSNLHILIFIVNHAICNAPTQAWFCLDSFHKVHETVSWSWVADKPSPHQMELTSLSGGFWNKLKIDLWLIAWFYPLWASHSRGQWSVPSEPVLLILTLLNTITCGHFEHPQSLDFFSAFLCPEINLCIHLRTYVLALLENSFCEMSCPCLSAACMTCALRLNGLCTCPPFQPFVPIFKPQCLNYKCLYHY